MTKKDEEKKESKIISTRRFKLKDGEKREVWTEEQRKTYFAMRDKLAPIVRDITTPPVEEKKKDALAEWLGIES